MSNPILDGIDQLGLIQKAKQENLSQVKANIDKFKTMKGDPFILMAIFMLGIMSGDSGGLFGRPIDPGSGGTKGNIISSQEDKVREVAGQKSVTNAFTSVLSEAQNAFNSGGNVADVRAKLKQVSDGLDKLDGAPGSPFDKASLASMRGAIDTLTKNLDTVEDKYNTDGKGTFTELFDKAKDPTNVGASTLIKNFNDQFSTLSTTTQTMSNMTSTNMQMVNADYQQYLGVLNSLLQAFHKQTQAHVQNQPKG